MAQKANSPHFPAFRLSRLSAALASCFISGTVLALPTGANVAHGTAVFARNGQVLTVTNSNGAIINWQGFSIGAGETTRFIQPSAVSSVLNRVVADNPSLILGQLQSNGRVFLINPAGIMVGAGARVDVAGFVASSLQLSDADFLAKRFHFTAVPGAGAVRNEGEIRTPTGGSVYLIAPQVDNAGLIHSPAGEVILAAGQTVEIGDTATPGVRAAIAGDGKTTNVGRIVADAGSIGLVGALVKNAGSLNASSAVSEGGRVYLRASATVEQTAAGKIDASGTRGGQVQLESDDMAVLEGSVFAVGHNDTGGEIRVLGERVGLVGDTLLDASGRTGGGAILVGGDYQGKNAAVRNAEFTYVGTNTRLKADAQDRGAGGKVIVWADNATRAYGGISARGGAQGGDGGFVEVSGKQYLDFRGQADLRAPHGKAGSLLLDPADLYLCNSSVSCEMLYGNTFNNTGTDLTTNPKKYFYGGGQISYLYWGSVVSQLSQGNVFLTTDGVAGAGDISFADSGAYSYTSANSLSFLAHRNITMSDAQLRNFGTGAVKMIAGWNGSSSAPAVSTNVSDSGEIWIKDGGSLQTLGLVELRAKDNITLEMNQGVGDVFVRGGGTSQTIVAGNEIHVTGGAAGAAYIRYDGPGTQTLNADKIFVHGDSSGIGDNHSAVIKSLGNQTIVAATAIDVAAGGDTLGGGGNYAAIEASGGQFLQAPSIRVQGGDGGSLGFDNYAAISQLKLTGSQKIVITGGGSGLEVAGGSGTGTKTWTFTECPGCQVSNNSAYIRNKGSGTQEIDFVGGGALILTGGSGIDGLPEGSLNDASISNEGSGTQKIWSSTGSHPDITVIGGSSGGYYNTTYQRNLGNEAGIHSDGTQIIKANSLTLGGGGGSASVGGAFLTGAVQNITVTNDLTIVGGASTVAGEYGMGTPTVIGHDNGADISITVGGDFNAAGNVGATGGMVMIGAAEGQANIDITAGSLVFGARSYLGNLDQSAGGSVALRATAGGISQSGSFSRLLTHSLTALATDAIDFSYDARVNYADMYTTSGNVSLWTNNATTHLVRLRTDNGSISAINGTGNLALGTIQATGGASLTARRAILDDNGNAAVNVTAPSIYLTSQFGGLSGGLAISADVQSPGGAVSAYVGYEGAPAYGGVRIESLGSVAPASLSITDTALAGGDLFYKHHGDVSSNANFAVSSQSGSLIFGATGNLGLAAGSFVAPGGMAFTAGGNLDVSGNLSLGSTSSLIAAGNMLIDGALTVSAPTTIVAGGGLAVPGSISASRLTATTGGAMSVNGGAITVSGPLALDVGNLGVVNGSLVTTGALTVSADDVSVDGGTLQAGSGVFLSLANLLVKDGGKITAQTGGVRVEAAQDVKVMAGGEIKAPAGAVTLLTNRDVVVDGALTAGTTVSLDALNMLSVGGSVLASGAATMVADGSVDVTGNISASRLSVTAGGAMSVNGGAITVSGPLALDVGNLGVVNGSLVTTGALTVSADDVSVDGGTLQAGSGIFLSLANLLVKDGGKITAQTGGVRVEAAQDVKVMAGGEIKAPAGAVTLLAGRDLALDGVLTAGTTVSLDALNMLSVGGSVLAGSAAHLVADGGVTVAGQVDCADLELTTGGDLLVNGGRLSAANSILLKAFNAQLADGATVKTDYGHIVGEIGQNLKLSNGSKILAGDDVKLSFAAVDSRLILNEMAGLAPSVIEADRYTMVPATIYLDFLAASGGGVVVDGLETTTTQAGGSGFYAAGAPATPGAGLQLAYGVPLVLPAPINDILNTRPPVTDSTSLQMLSPLPVQTTDAAGGQLAGQNSTANNDEFGGGSTTGDNNEGKNRNRRRGGMCRG